MNARCDIVDFINFYNFICPNYCSRCPISNGCFLIYYGFEYENITLYSEGENV